MLLPIRYLLLVLGIALSPKSGRVDSITVSGDSGCLGLLVCSEVHEIQIPHSMRVSSFRIPEPSCDHTFQWICSIANHPPDLTKPHCNPAHQYRPVHRTQPSSRTLDNPHLGLSGQTILVQHLTNYRLTGQSILYQLQTGWLVSIMILIVPIANWVASGYCNHCRPGGWNVLS